MAAQCPAPDRDEPSLNDAQGLDPSDLLRALLAISPDDAAAVREDAAEAMKPGQEPER